MFSKHYRAQIVVQEQHKLVVDVVCHVVLAIHWSSYPAHSCYPSSIAGLLHGPDSFHKVRAYVCVNGYDFDCGSSFALLLVFTTPRLR
jgi:hypothetical protein